MTSTKIDVIHHLDSKTAITGQTSGSDDEIVERTTMLLKGDVTMERSSLLDIFNYGSWIKKSSFEGFFNLFIFILVMVAVNMALFNYYIYGRIVKTDLLIGVAAGVPKLALKWIVI